ncbi:MAG: hypothetical protein IKR48_08565 [Kiritimatiellae bacterium]|nr:hypothetical protein [Kiritimatiellia bacterium]
MRRIFCLCVVMVACRSAALDWETDPEGPLFKMTAKEYRFDEWKGKTAEPYPCPLREWSLPPLDFPFPTNGVVGNVYIQRMGRTLEIYGKDHKHLVYVNWSVLPTVLDAQKAIIENFADCSIPVIDFVYENGIGDKCFWRTYPDTTKWTPDGWVEDTTQRGKAESFTFCRNNVMIRLMGIRAPFSGEAIARQIDADILKRSREAVAPLESRKTEPARPDASQGSGTKPHSGTDKASKPQQKQDKLEGKETEKRG